ncbi:unknown [Firmicutes bacterium CAG:449]|jgi:hypothetical protein|nr:unknown [Firmicutes bacterium CAG:449]
MFNKKEQTSIKDLKNANGEIETLIKEIKKEAKQNKQASIIDEINLLDFDIDYKSTLISSLTEEQIKDEINLTEQIKLALLDTQELLKKGTEYGVKLGLDRVNTMLEDRKVAKSPFLVENYRLFESNLWNITKLRELAYGNIQRLKAKQDKITLEALKETDSMMRVRYFEDIRVLEKNILALENEAHQYDSYQVALQDEKVLKNILRKYSTNKKDEVSLIEFEKTVNKYEGK